MDRILLALFETGVVVIISPLFRNGRIVLLDPASHFLEEASLCLFGRLHGSIGIGILGPEILQGCWITQVSEPEPRINTSMAMGGELLTPLRGGGNWVNHQ